MWKAAAAAPRWDGTGWDGMAWHGRCLRTLGILGLWVGFNRSGGGGWREGEAVDDGHEDGNGKRV